MGPESQIHAAAGNLNEKAKKAARDATLNPVMETLMRLGYVIRGLVYGVIGLLALQVALGGGHGKLTDSQGAIAFMGSSFLGRLFLYIILAGLVGYGLWGLVRAIVDPLHKGTDLKGIAERMGFAISGISYLLLAWPTFNLVRGAGGAQNGAQTAQLQKFASTIFTKPWGEWVVGFVAVCIIASGAIQIYRGVGPNFPLQYKPYALNDAQRKNITRIGRFGTAARGLVFTLVGVFLFLAAYNHDPSQAKGVDQVLAEMLKQPYGPWLLGIVALGLIAFGIYSALSGFWLRIKR